MDKTESFEVCPSNLNDTRLSDTSIKRYLGVSLPNYKCLIPSKPEDILRKKSCSADLLSLQKWSKLLWLLQTFLVRLLGASRHLNYCKILGKDRNRSLIYSATVQLLSHGNVAIWINHLLSFLWAGMLHPSDLTIPLCKWLIPGLPL